MTVDDTVAIEPLAPAHFEMAARWLATPALNRWLTPDWRERPANTTTLAIATRNRRNRLFLVRHNQEPCGLVALSDFDEVEKTAMAWYLLGAPHLGGKGITTAAVRTLVGLAFGQFGLRSLHAWAMAQNEASQRVLAKAGFREAGRLRQSASLDGQPTDRIYFDLVADDYAAPLARSVSNVHATAEAPQSQ